MRDPARILTCIITALTVASCVPGNPVDLDRNPWTPPPNQVVDFTDSWGDEETLVVPVLVR